MVSTQSDNSLGSSDAYLVPCDKNKQTGKFVILPVDPQVSNSNDTSYLSLEVKYVTTKHLFVMIQYLAQDIWSQVYQLWVTEPQSWSAVLNDAIPWFEKYASDNPFATFADAYGEFSRQKLGRVVVLNKNHKICDTPCWKVVDNIRKNMSSNIFSFHAVSHGSLQTDGVKRYDATLTLFATSHKNYSEITRLQTLQSENRGRLRLVQKNMDVNTPYKLDHKSHFELKRGSGIRYS